ncbi:MAG: TRAP transporter small permease [Candidatus Tectomicrobia bacterium]|nr:TRAP transporter small permease [Candidatus Tectomicrobia bacterium]
MKALRAADRWLARAEGALLVALLAAMVGGSFLQVLLRNIFHTGLEGADVLLRHGVLWVALLGASLATREARHIRIDVLPRLIPPRFHRFKRLMEGLACLATLGVSAALAGASFTLVRGEREAGTALALGLPTWAAQAILPAGFLLITFHLAVRGIEGFFPSPPPAREEA